MNCYCGPLVNDVNLGVVLTCTMCHLGQHTVCSGFCALFETVFVCGICRRFVTVPVKVKSTLIVVPAVLKQQWKSEFAKHVKVGEMSMVEYCGVSGQTAYVSPAALGAHDIVLTTYEVLRKEFVHLFSSNIREVKLRASKIYPVVPCPLGIIDFFRVALDEAQLVDNSHSHSAAMAASIRAVNRWCITGTPITSSVDDLFGLLCFLGADPFNDRSVWNICKGKQLIGQACDVRQVYFQKVRCGAAGPRCFVFTPPPPRNLFSPSSVLRTMQ